MYNQCNSLTILAVLSSYFDELNDFESNLGSFTPLIDQSSYFG